MATPARLTRREALARLWAHESLRVFHDRLVSTEDKAVLRRLLAEAAQVHLPSLLQPEELSGMRPLLYGDFHVANIAVDEREYGEVCACDHAPSLPLCGLQWSRVLTRCMQADPGCGKAGQDAQGTPEGVQHHTPQAAVSRVLPRCSGACVPHCAPSEAAARFRAARGCLWEWQADAYAVRRMAVRLPVLPA